MKSAIEDIINGKRGKIDQYKISEEYKTALRESNEIEKIFVEKLKKYPELLELYRKVSETDEIACAAEMHDVYKEAFRFAFLIAVDVFCAD
ncbi:MAG: hypothetical protein K2K12_03380 [Clostridia bacterium]|nr:hypothetical protein [Clostridia bacterium]